ncbi:hypothetical protein JYB55_03655 [Mycolicibacterium septicum]|nr:hypothetical protein [Mycolicibacterium septicum]
MTDALGEDELCDVRVIAERLEALREINGLVDIVIEPELAGCGFISRGVPDFIGKVQIPKVSGLVLGEIKMVERPFRSVDYRQVICYLTLYFAQHGRILDYLWLVNPIRGTLVHIDVDSFFLLTRGQASSEAVPELAYEWSSPGVSP